MVKASTLEWTSSARWGDTVTVDAETEKLGRTSVTVRFTVRVGERVCCVVRNTYVAPTPAGRRRGPTASGRARGGVGAAAHRRLTPRSGRHQPAFS